MKSLTKIRSLSPKVLNAWMSSGSVYSFTVKECIGPLPLANQRTRTFKTSDRETIFSADKCGHLSLNHFRMTCGETPTFLARTSVSVTPAANIAAFSLAPKFGMNPPSANKTAEVELTQDTENKVSHFLTTLNKSFAAAHPQGASSLAIHCGLFPAFQSGPDGRGLFVFHSGSFPFFHSLLTGNSTGKGGYSNE